MNGALTNDHRVTDLLLRVAEARARASQTRDPFVLAAFLKIAAAYELLALHQVLLNEREQRRLVRARAF